MEDVAALFWAGGRKGAAGCARLRRLLKVVPARDCFAGLAAVRPLGRPLGFAGAAAGFGGTRAAPPVLLSHRHSQLMPATRMLGYCRGRLLNTYPGMACS